MEALFARPEIYLSKLELMKGWNSIPSVTTVLHKGMYSCPIQVGGKWATQTPSPETLISVQTRPNNSWGTKQPGNTSSKLLLLFSPRTKDDDDNTGREKHQKVRTFKLKFTRGYFKGFYPHKLNSFKIYWRREFEMLKNLLSSFFRFRGFRYCTEHLPFYKNKNKCRYNKELQKCNCRWLFSEMTKVIIKKLL